MLTSTRRSFERSTNLLKLYFENVTAEQSNFRKYRIEVRTSGCTDECQGVTVR